MVKNGLIKLLPPNEPRQGWQSDVTDDEVDEYLKDAQKANLKEGVWKAPDMFSMWSGTLQCISPRLKYCFVQSKCIPQPQLNSPMDL